MDDPTAGEPVPTTLDVELVDATHQLTPTQSGWLSAQSLAAGRRLGCVGVVRVRVVDDPEMAQAHVEFMDVPGTTDVLTFDLRGGDPYEPAVFFGSGMLLPDLDRLIPAFVDADVLVCLDEARRQAGTRGYPFERELLLYVVHAMLHCLGLDDHEEQQAAAMHRLEDAVLEAIGVGAAFRILPGSEGEAGRPS